MTCKYLNELVAGPQFPQGASKWCGLRWHAVGDGLLDALTFLRNERERDSPLQVLMDAFEVKARAWLTLLDQMIRVEVGFVSSMSWPLSRTCHRTKNFSQCR